MHLQIRFQRDKNGVKRTKFREFLNLTKLSDSTENEYKSKKFRAQIIQFTEEVKDNINPFSENLNATKLFNLSTGKAASADTTEFLLNVADNGMKQMKTFISECSKDTHVKNCWPKQSPEQH